ncbi:hypothetical protein GDO81_015827 [Engystomops pustulosus]|uniref:Uncharacterized protein n=1 Tax=Engystomops pustulosus TaxID=76066 RepID=A0AAV7AMP9_ENGPU|nr:hypothetical protein GDO81_015827 [Engystomops pustulosus]
MAGKLKPGEVKSVLEALSGVNTSLEFKACTDCICSARKTTWQFRGRRWSLGKKKRGNHNLPICSNMSCNKMFSQGK